MPVRFDFLDGVRGVMCAIVVVYHVFIHPASLASTLESNFWLGFVVNGHLAVEMFWVASGFSLACVTEPESVVKAMIARLPRLFIPIVCAVPVSMLVLGVFHPIAFLRNPCALVLNILNPKTSVHLNPFLTDNFAQLWSLTAEIYGSFVVLATTLVRPHVARPFVPTALAVAWLYYAAPDVVFLLVGVLAREVHLRVLPPIRDTPKGTAVAVASTLTFFGIHFFVERFRQVYIWGPNAARTGLLYNWARLIRCCALFTAIGSSSVAASFFETRVALFLGRNSFAVYICHLTVIRFFQQFAVLNPLALRLVIVLTVSYVFSEYCWRHVDTAAMKWSKAFAGVWIRGNAGSATGGPAKQLEYVVARRHSWNGDDSESARTVII